MPIGKCAAIGPASTPNAAQAARRPCSDEVAARLGIADHVARREDVGHRGAEARVDPDPTRARRPRGPPRPGRGPRWPRGGRPRRGPMSVTMRLPDSRVSTAFRGGPSARSMQSTASPSRSVTFRLRIWWSSSSTISRSRNSSGRSRRSTSVTATPRAARMDVYSIPMTPAPTTHIVRGSCFRRTMSSVSRMISPSRLTPGEGAGWVPTAIRMCSAVTRRRAAVAVDRQRVRIDERGHAGQDAHVVPPELVLDHLDLAGDHAVHPREELLARRPRVEAGPGQAVALARQARERDHRLPQGLARDGAGVDAGAAHAAPLLDDGRPPPELRCLHRGALAGGAAADADEVEVVGGAHSTLVGATCQISSAYCRIVRSLENLPMLATFRMDFVVHAASSR